MRQQLQVLALVGSLTGCWLDAKPPVKSALERCRDEARAAYYSGDAGLDASEALYDRCVEREVQ